MPRSVMQESCQITIAAKSLQVKTSSWLRLTIGHNGDRSPLAFPLSLGQCRSTAGDGRCGSVAVEDRVITTARRATVPSLNAHGTLALLGTPRALLVVVASARFLFSLLPRSVGNSKGRHRRFDR